MKELSIEEKAKRYNDAIKVAQRFYNNCVAITKEGLEYIFPELKESEDERIRKTLIAVVNLYYGEGEDEEKTACLYWLEKQGDNKKFRDSIQVGDKVTRNEEGILINLSQLNRVAKKDKKQGEQKPNPCENCGIATNNCQKFPCAIRDGEQKPAWSEEDERNLQGIIDELKTNKNHAPAYDLATYNRFLSWLKSLKDRVQPQPKQEWSEEDEKMLEQCCVAITDSYFNKIAKGQILIDWLKSIRGRFTWKPSDEHYELEEFAKIVRCNLTGISKAVQKLFEAKYL